MRVLLAWGVHLFTACGAVAGAAGLLARLTLEPCRRFLIPAVHAHVRAFPRMGDHVGVHVKTDPFEEVDEPDPFDHFADPLVLQGVLGEEINGFFGYRHQALVVFV